MGSKFFDQLVNDRRDGVAPPQLEQMKQAEPEPEAEQARPAEVTFSASQVPGAWSCDRCFSLVDARLTPNHANEHYQTGT